ncbi:MAG TPA: hypothetical protein VFO38_01510 [Candidatus Saccharimonadales bacterium]|nr:hypothetical protein [Candidatus Saccharimonadales bacterium]
MTFPKAPEVSPDDAQLAFSALASSADKGVLVRLRAQTQALVLQVLLEQRREEFFDDQGWLNVSKNRLIHSLLGVDDTRATYLIRILRYQHLLVSPTAGKSSRTMIVCGPVAKLIVQALERHKDHGEWWDAREALKDIAASWQTTDAFTMSLSLLLGRTVGVELSGQDATAVTKALARLNTAVNGDEALLAEVALRLLRQLKQSS